MLSSPSLTSSAIDLAGGDPTARASITAMRASGILMSSDYGDKGPGYDNTAAINSWLTAIKNQNGRKGGFLMPWTTDVSAKIVTGDLSGVTLLGVPGQSILRQSPTAWSSDFALLQLGNLSDVLVEGVGFTGTYTSVDGNGNNIEDGGYGLLYSYNSVLRTAFRRCVFSNPGAFSNALSFYVRVNATQTTNSLNGLWIEDNEFVTGRQCLLVMNRSYSVTDPEAAMQRVFMRRNNARPGQAAPTGSVNGMLVSLDGRGQLCDISQNLIQNNRGICIENTGYSSTLISYNIAKDFSRGTYMLAYDASSTAAKMSGVRSIGNRMLGDPTGALHSNYFGLDGTCLVDGDDICSQTTTQAADFRYCVGLIVKNSRFTNYNRSGNYAVLVESSSTVDFDENCIFDNSLSNNNYATIRFYVNYATNSIVRGKVKLPARILKGPGGAYIDQSTGGADDCYMPFLGVNRSVVFTGSISGATLTITNVETGTIATGYQLSGAGVTPGTIINSFQTGSGSTGTYGLNFGQVVTSTLMSGGYPSEQGRYGTQALVDTNPVGGVTAITGSTAMTCFEELVFTGTLTTQAIVNFPSPEIFKQPGGMRIRNDCNWPIQLQVKGVNAADIIYPKTSALVTWDISLKSLRADKAAAPTFQGTFTVATLPSAAGAGKGASAYASDALNMGESTGAGTGSQVVSTGSVWRIPGIAGAVAA